MKKSRLQEELEEMFGEETVKTAVMQEFLARRYTTNHPIQVRKTLDRFQKIKDLEKQKEFAAQLDKEMARAVICSLLCGSASQALLDLATQAIEDKRKGRAVLGGKIIPK